MSEYRSRRGADNYESTNPGPGCRGGAVACRTGNLHLIEGEAGRTLREAARRAKGRRLRSGWFLLAAGWSLLAAPGLPLGAAAAYGAADEITAYHPQNGLDPGYVDLYNLDFAGAHKQFSAWMQAHPEDPLGSASDAAAYLFGEFDRLSSTKESTTRNRAVEVRLACARGCFRASAIAPFSPLSLSLVRSQSRLPMGHQPALP